MAWAPAGQHAERGRGRAPLGPWHTPLAPQTRRPLAAQVLPPPAPPAAHAAALPAGKGTPSSSSLLNADAKSWRRQRCAAGDTHTARVSAAAAERGRVRVRAARRRRAT